MSGYCEDCGNTLCICDEITEDNLLDPSKHIIITKEDYKFLQTQIQKRDRIIEKTFNEIFRISSGVFGVSDMLHSLINMPEFKEWEKELTNGK